MSRKIGVPLQMRMPARVLALVALGALSAALALQATGRPADESGFSIVLLPDTQNYSQKYPETYLVQTRWIAERSRPDNIKFVIHLGDIVQNWDAEEQWKVADQAHRLLDGVVPYSMLPGNHDMRIPAPRLTTFYNQYFPPSRFEGFAWYGGHMGETNDNNYSFFEAAGMQFMVLSLEYCPREETLQWADRILRQHRNRRVIVATHLYLKGFDLQGHGEVVRDNTIPLTSIEDNNGEEMWEKLIRKHENIFMVVCGHRHGVGLQTHQNDAGKKVYQLLSNAQHLENGGNGWLTILRFMPGENRIYVDNYSPLLEKYNNDPVHKFRLMYPQDPDRSSEFR